MLTSDKEEKHVILPTTLTIAVRTGKLRIYTLQNPSEVFNRPGVAGAVL